MFPALLSDDLKNVGWRAGVFEGSILAKERVGKLHTGGSGILHHQQYTTVPCLSSVAVFTHYFFATN